MGDEAITTKKHNAAPESSVVLLRSSLIERHTALYEQHLECRLPHSAFETLLEESQALLPKHRHEYCSLSESESDLVTHHAKTLEALRALRDCLLCEIEREAPCVIAPGHLHTRENALRALLDEKEDHELLRLAELLIEANLHSCELLDTSSLEQSLLSANREEIIEAVIQLLPDIASERWQLLVAFAQWCKDHSLFDRHGFDALQIKLGELMDARRLLERALVRSMVNAERERFLAAHAKLSAREAGIAESIILASAFEFKVPPSKNFEYEDDTQTDKLFDAIEEIKKKAFAQEDVYCDKIGEARQVEKRKIDKKIEECRQEKAADKRRIREFLAQYQDIDEADKMRLLDRQYTIGISEDELADIAAKVRAKRARRPKRQT